MAFTPEVNFVFVLKLEQTIFFCANQNQFFYFNLSIKVIKYIIKKQTIFFLS